MNAQPRHDLQAARAKRRESMVYQVDLLFDAMADLLLRPVDSNAPRGIFDPAPEDPKEYRLHPEAEAEVNELRRQMVDLVRRASMIRGPAARQSLRVISGGAQ